MLSRRVLQEAGKWLGRARCDGARGLCSHRQRAAAGFRGLRASGGQALAARPPRPGTRHMATNIVESPYTGTVIPDALLHEHVWESYKRWPDHVAIECAITGQKYTFQQLRERCTKFAAALIKAGFKPGQVIAIILPNLPDFPIAVLGAIEAGLIVSPVNPSYTADEMSHQFLNSKTVCAITFHAKLEETLLVKSRVEEKTKGAQKVDIISIQDYGGVQRPSPPGVWSFREMVENDLDTSGVASVCRDSGITQRDLVVLPYSSGTTGLPKGVCLNHYNIVANLSMIENKATEHILDPEGDRQDVLPAVLPFFHIYGFTIIMMSSLRHGGKLVTLPKFEPDSFINTLKQNKSTIMYIVPPIILFLSAHPGVTKEQLDRMRVITSGAAPLGASDIEKCLDKVPSGMLFIQAYGLTETSPVALLPCNTSQNHSTVGPPCSLTKAKVIDPNTGEALGPNKQGEICIYGPQVMEGYLNNQKATDETLHDGWLHTGDIGYYDEKSDFYIVDRLKELIKVKGFQVAPAELEELLRCHPKVSDVAVIGIPDARAGEVPVAYVVRKGDVQEEELQGFVAGKVAHYKQLSRIIFTETIPKSPSGKILRRFLKAAHLKQMGK